MMLASLSFFLAFLTYRLVEIPAACFFTRRSVSHKQLVKLGGLASLLLALAAFGLMSHANQQKSTGFYRQLDRAAEDVPELRGECHLSTPFQGLPDASNCVNRSDMGAPDLLLWGTPTRTTIPRCWRSYPESCSFLSCRDPSVLVRH
ncbi:hypothetical protein EKK97_02655 [Billgrantia tianxiuensis]|uniref:Uncharacterized protein n=1 Tax=Billgrantia tianxiuensis TaxID=2497861 RepID=A0A6I6SJV1_9GAMM|nr:hypothetical protein [Halomonas tianxiuensis]QHC48724.1 hypothetical protein EKK97_02655 [Halomonas tianxiuensis]